MTHETADFTEARYCDLIDLARARLEFRRIGQDLSADRIAVWRHDIDFSPQRALALARIENARGVPAVYYVLLSSLYYNSFEPVITRILREIVALGHDIGLHYDASLLPDSAGLAAHEERVAFEAGVLSGLIGQKVNSFSLHNTTVTNGPLLTSPTHAGLINATAPALRDTFEYCSDSNGIWRFRPLHEVILDDNVQRLYALTHPEWWQAAPLSPRQRIQRCIDGRKRSAEHYYDALLSAYKRPNVGREEIA